MHTSTDCCAEPNNQKVRLTWKISLRDVEVVEDDMSLATGYRCVIRISFFVQEITIDFRQDVFLLSSAHASFPGLRLLCAV